jgi:hypothetical protein
VKTPIEIDSKLLAEAEKAAHAIGQPLSLLVEISLANFLKNEKQSSQEQVANYQGGSLDRSDPFFSILAKIEEERHSNLPREPIVFE